MYRDAPADPTDDVTTALAAALATHRFEPKPLGESFEFARYKLGSTTTDGVDTIPIKGAWVKKTWSTNDAVLHLGVPDDSTERLSALSLRVEQAVRDRIGYIYYLKPVALQIVWSGERLAERTAKLDAAMAELEVYTRDRLHRERSQVRADPRSNLLAIFVIDLLAKRLIRQPHPRMTRRQIYDAITHCLETLVSPDDAPA